MPQDGWYPALVSTILADSCSIFVVGVGVAIDAGSNVGVYVGCIIEYLVRLDVGGDVETVGSIVDDALFTLKLCSIYITDSFAHSELVFSKKTMVQLNQRKM